MPPGAPVGMRVVLHPEPLYADSLPEYVDDASRHAWLARESARRYPRAFRRDAAAGDAEAAHTGWALAIEKVVELGEDDVVEAMHEPLLGPFDSCARAWAELRAREAALLAAGHVRHLGEEERGIFGWAEGDEITPPRPHAGTCVLDLDKLAPAIVYACCVALRAAGSVRYAPDARNSELLSPLATHRTDCLLGADVCYGPIRIFFAAELWQLDRELHALSRDAFAASWTPAADGWPAVLGALRKEQLCAEGELEHALGHFEALRAFVHSAAKRGLGMIAHHW